jgi:DNA-binding helix-hairpin-helix protein with protein kinase domain
VTELYDHAGHRVKLGAILSSGGEGAVYDVPGQGGGHVAKIYHEVISGEKQWKLRFMIKAGCEALKKVSAWPLATLQTKVGGTVCGFLMPKLVGYEPLHQLYGPAQRKQRFPDKDWGFLLYTARNVAATFAVVHRHGHVIGDVNPDLVYVSRDSTVKLIDCDSFQIMANGFPCLCEVGVSHFTPPELQRLLTFRGTIRTTNHDLFGLALLLFHLLLMGRHPFSGVYQGSEDMPLEKSIAHFRYAYGMPVSGRALSPPPNSVTPEILPNNIRQLFEGAFTEPGATNGWRPTAKAWVGALDCLLDRLIVCKRDPAHKYFRGLPACPWCAQEIRTGIKYFIWRSAPPSKPTPFNLSLLWAEISAVESPGKAPAIVTTKMAMLPVPLPPEIETIKKTSAQRKIAALVIVAAGFAAGTPLWLLSLTIGALIFCLGKNPRPLIAELKKKREQALNLAQNALQNAQLNWVREAGDGKFEGKKRELANLRREYESLSDQLVKEKHNIREKALADALHLFLATFLLEDFEISGVGPLRKATLVSSGIKSAADVNYGRVISIDGFGQKLAEVLLDWRHTLEPRFVFDARKNDNQAAITSITRRYDEKRNQLEGQIRAGLHQLKQIREDTLRRRVGCCPRCKPLLPS